MANHPIWGVMQKNPGYLPCVGRYAEKFCLITILACYPDYIMYYLV
jgi:hypothetical protein